MDIVDRRVLSAPSGYISPSTLLALGSAEPGAHPASDRARIASDRARISPEPRAQILAEHHGFDPPNPRHDCRPTAPKYPSLRDQSYATMPRDATRQPSRPPMGGPAAGLPLSTPAAAASPAVPGSPRASPPNADGHPDRHRPPSSHSSKRPQSPPLAAPHRRLRRQPSRPATIANQAPPASQRQQACPPRYPPKLMPPLRHSSEQTLHCASAALVDPPMPTPCAHPKRRLLPKQPTCPAMYRMTR